MLRSVPFVLVALLAAPLVAGQIPGVPLPGAAPTVAVDVAFESPEGRVSVEEPRQFLAVVTNDSPASGSPADDQNRAEITMAATGAPAGWTVSVNPAAFDLAPGETRDVTVQVLVAADGAKQGTITLTATLSSPLESFDPVLGNVPGGNQTTTDSAAIELSRSESASRNLLETIGDWIWVVLLALVAAVVLVVRFAMQGRRAAVAIEAPEQAATIAPGGRTSINLTVRNLSGKSDTVVFEVSAVPPGWAAFLPVTDLTLAAEAAHELALVVIAPADAQHGDRQTILVAAASPRAKEPATAALDVVVGVPAAALRRKRGE